MRTLFVILTVCLTGTTFSAANGQLIIAHRGASYDAPENTLAAFKLAWEKQADGVEGDFYLTKDRQIACIHDKTTKRTAPDQPNLKVAESTLAELQKLDVGSWKHQRFADERIPTLEDVLRTVPEGKLIFVEIKCGPEILPILKPQLAASGLKPEQIVIICFNQDVVTQSRAMMPEYKVNWLTGYKQKNKDSEWKPTRSDVLATLKRTNVTGFGTQGNLKVIDRAFADAVHNSGHEFHVWTINDPEPARTFAAYGVHSITTDRPAVIRKAIQTQSAQSSR